MPGNGFEASWAVPFIARGVPAEGDTNMLANLGHTAMAVSFVEMVDPYQSVTRALKYSPLFIFLIFLSYFLFEVTTGKRVHPAQYVLIGIAQTIFFVLLLSIAERIGFDFAFILSAIATVGLISIYAKWTFDSRAQGLRALAIFSLLYGLIYILLRLEDQALLVGSIASFVAIAAAMYFTRSMNWYGEQAPPPAPTGPPPAV
jgi:inner membrane protein